VYTLFTIPFSHYNEKARWALERFGVPFRERAYMPMFHFAPVMVATRFGRHGSAGRTSTRFSTPLLVTGDGTRVCDSSAILHHLSSRYADDDTTLFPDPKVEALERDVSERLGPHTRRVAYGLVFADPSIIVELVGDRVGPVQTRLWQWVHRPVLASISRALQVEPGRVERSVAAIRSIFAEFSDRIAGRRYLLGERFSAADMAFATMAAPAVVPTHEDGYVRGLPSLDRLPRRAADLAKELRATEAGRYVLRILAEERGVVVRPAAA
jgi:glutathione S-transferase